MVAAGLLLSLDPQEPVGRLSARLVAGGAVFPGAVEGSWLPVAVEAEDDAGLRELHDWIAGLPGVAFVDVVHVSFEDPSTIDPTLSSP